MKHEIESLERTGLESRAQEERLKEDLIERPFESLDDVDQRSTIARFLNRSSFPAEKSILVDDARGNGAYDWVVQRLENLPEGRTFDNVQAVWESLGGQAEERF